MLARTAVRPAIRATAAPTTTPESVRTMATLREIELRLKSVRNIEKITKSMKMIASTKMVKAQRAMGSAKSYGQANSEIFNTAKPAELPKRKLFIVVSSDKGLCGGVHSGLSKLVRRTIADPTANVDPESPIVVIGDKAKSQLSRVLSKNLILTINQVGKDVPTFADATGVADLIFQTGAKYESIILVHNKFLSAISYEPAMKEIQPQPVLEKTDGFRKYDQEEDHTSHLAQFTLANAVYSALVEGHAAEISARRNAMDNASKNAGDMIGSLQLRYNRGRQAAITNELVDIITGASAL
ncbi:ATP synthase F1 gamma [Serendipita vermifera]|nr:ATP synthase F1 gamma [Serendipita vermifera]